MRHSVGWMMFIINKCKTAIISIPSYYFNISLSTLIIAPEYPKCVTVSLRKRNYKALPMV